MASLSLAEIRLQVVSLAHKPGEDPKNVLNRADTYLAWVLGGEDKGDNPPSFPGEPGASSGDNLDESAPGAAPGQASQRSNQSNRSRR